MVLSVVSVHTPVNHHVNADGLSTLCNTRYKCNRTPASGIQSKSYFQMGNKLVTKQWNMYQFSVKYPSRIYK